MTIEGTPSVPESAGRRRVLVITGDPIGVKLAGPAIRAWSIAEHLSVDNDVTLISLASIEKVEAPFRLAFVSPFENDDFAPYEDWADVIVFQGHAMEFFEALQKSTKILVADIYDPMHLEQLEQAREFPREVWEERVGTATEVLNQQLARADFFLCASERQKFFYLGQLAALGRISPANYEHDPDFRGLIAVVPFGLVPEFPKQNRRVLKGVHSGIGRDDKVLIWSGGLYNWFDPKTLIKAVGILAERRPTVRLYFQGTKHPNSGVPEMAIVGESKHLAQSLHLLNKAVFFNKSWVDYADRHNYLTEADAGVSTHFDHIETTMSFRTRILDYLWAGLPMVVTNGDIFAELIEHEELGLVVPATDEGKLAEALDRILFDEDLIDRVRANIARVRERYFWDRVLEPLVQFVGEGRHSGDATEAIALAKEAPVTHAERPPSPASTRWQTTVRAVGHLKSGGPLLVMQKIAGRFRR